MSISNVATGASALDQYQIDSDRFATGDELGKDQFLELLVAQMNNQDPLSPQENGEFIAQLAQFSTVEGIGNLNTSMESLLSGYQSSQALQASSLVGRTVIVPADQAVVDTEAGLEGQLTATLQIGEGDEDHAAKLLPTLSRKVGRILTNGWPTGVEVTHAMVHGGPFPATSDGRSTSVGTLAVERFLRPVSYQDMPAALLPNILREGVQGTLRRVDGEYRL